MGSRDRDREGGREQDGRAGSAAPDNWKRHTTLWSDVNECERWLVATALRYIDERVGRVHGGATGRIFPLAPVLLPMKTMEYSSGSLSLINAVRHFIFRGANCGRKSDPESANLSKRDQFFLIILLVILLDWLLIKLIELNLKLKMAALTWK